MKFAESSPLYSVRCSVYLNSQQEWRASLKFINDKNFNGVVIIIIIFFFVQGNTLKYLIFTFVFIFNLLN